MYVYARRSITKQSFMQILNLIADKYECKCKIVFYLNNVNCLSCQDLMMNNNCVNWISAFNNCADSDLCQRCTKEYNIKSSCVCSLGFRLVYESCENYCFYTYLAIKGQGSLDLVFSEDPMDIYIK